MALLAFSAKRVGAKNGLLAKIASGVPIPVLSHIAYDVLLNLQVSYVDHLSGSRTGISVSEVYPLASQLSSESRSVDWVLRFYVFLLPVRLDMSGADLLPRSP
jgi:hypothetical protein